MNTKNITVNDAGNITITDKLLRVTLGTVAIVTLLHYSIADDANLSYEILAALVIALSGLVGWDPIYRYLRKPGEVKSIKQFGSHPV